MKGCVHLLCIMLALCGSTAADGFADLDYFSHDNRERTYLLRVPQNYTSTTSLPLVVVLHGGGGNAVRMEEMTGFSELAERENFIVVYPNGTGRLPRRFLTWNSGYIELYASEHDVDDIGFIVALIERLQELYSIDPDMIFVTGICNGAMMAYRLAAEYSGVFAAAGAVAGSIGGQSDPHSELWVIPSPGSPVSVIIFHGMLDSHVLYHGGETQTAVHAQHGRIDMSVSEAVELFVDADWCMPVPSITTSDDGTIVTETWTGGDDATEVVLYTIMDAGHSWPGGHSWLPGDPPTDEISATELIWDFFQSHPGPPW